MSNEAPIFALVDCNNFYASCEKLFDPKLAGVPIVVLSNNDGCVVARSAEVKALDIPMGGPWFKLQAQAREHGIIPFSSNYALYADMSNRVVDILAQFSPEIEVYSIDECFLGLSGLAASGRTAYGQQIRERIQRWLGLAVCVGIAPTKTLAKLANHCAKKDLAGSAGVCDFTALNQSQLSALFTALDVSEVWGVGRQLAPRLRALKIRTVQDLYAADTAFIRRHFSVLLERTVQELRGTSCLLLEDSPTDRQQIMCSRSFGERIYDLENLEQAISSHLSRAAEKLRQQDALAGAVTVYLRTSPFSSSNSFNSFNALNTLNAASDHYQSTFTRPLPEATADSRLLAREALRILRQIYRPGFAYQKTGVMLSDICPCRQYQPSLFPGAGEIRSSAGSERLMQTLDRINSRWGRGTLRLATEGHAGGWHMKRAHLSPAYTTEWAGLPVVNAR